MKSLPSKKFKLLGFPLQHSLSPMIHNLFAQQFGLDLIYELQEVAAENLASTINTFIAQGGSGFNITAPYKELVFQQLTNLNQNAKIARAVNTIFIKPDGSICGDNTDGIGLSKDLDRHAISLQNKRVLILGAGGAVRGIMAALIGLQPKQIILCNRDAIKALKLKADFVNANLCLIANNELANTHADVIIHAISNLPQTNDLHENIYTKINFKNTFCYDLNYAAKSSVFLDYAHLNGAARLINGLGMLVEQAAAAFGLWYGLNPQTNVVLTQIQQKTGSL